MKMLMFSQLLLGFLLAIFLSAFTTDPALSVKKERTVKFIAPRGDCVDVYVRQRNDGSQVERFQINDSEEHTLTIDEDGDYQFRAKLCSANWCPGGIYTSVPFYTDDISITSYEVCN